MNDSNKWTTPEGQPAGQPVHIAPLGDIRDHVFDGLWCPCLPVFVPAESVLDEDGNLIQPDNSHGVIRHNSYDGREFGETILRTLDAMGVALTDHGHCWSPALRADYEKSVSMLKERFSSLDQNGGPR